MLVLSGAGVQKKTARWWSSRMGWGWLDSSLARVRVRVRLRVRNNGGSTTRPDDHCLSPWAGATATNEEMRMRHGRGDEW